MIRAKDPNNKQAEAACKNWDQFAVYRAMKSTADSGDRTEAIRLSHVYAEILGRALCDDWRPDGFNQQQYVDGKWLEYDPKWERGQSRVKVWGGKTLYQKWDGSKRWVPDYAAGVTALRAVRAKQRAEKAKRRAEKAERERAAQEKNTAVIEDVSARIRSLELECATEPKVRLEWVVAKEMSLLRRQNEILYANSYQMNGSDVVFTGDRAEWHGRDFNSRLKQLALDHADFNEQLLAGRSKRRKSQ